jgi:hypothetical protein
MRVWIVLALAACDGGGPSEDLCAESAKIVVYADNDEDGYGAVDTSKPVCPPVDENGQPTGKIPRGFSANDKDCDDSRSEVNPAAIEACNGLDDDCDEEQDEGLRELLFFLDGDSDGFGNPEADLGTTSCAAPAGFVDNGFDCNDEDATIHPDATEVCDGGIDNDCDDRADDLDVTLDLSTAPTHYLDDDGDSYGDPDVFVTLCLAPGASFVSNADDCDDADVDVNPGAAEVCNRIDDDCDQRIDDSDSDIRERDQSTWYADADGDGYGDPDPATATLACWQPWFYVTNTDDCDDENPFLGPPAPWVRDRDGDGFGSGTPSAADCTPPGADYVLLALGLDCNDNAATGATSYPANPLTGDPAGNEICDGNDNDCDTLIDGQDDSLDLNDPLTLTFYRDADGDTFGDEDLEILACNQPPGFVADDRDCDDADRFVNPNGNEVCDGVDNDCDRAVDDQDPSVDPASALTWYADFDGDSFGDDAQTRVSCVEPPFYDATGGDCDDTDEFAYPGAPETCNDGIDQDCDGSDASCFAPARGGRPLGARPLPPGLTREALP